MPKLLCWTTKLWLPFHPQVRPYRQLIRHHHQERKPQMNWTFVHSLYFFNCCVFALYITTIRLLFLRELADRLPSVAFQLEKNPNFFFAKLNFLPKTFPYLCKLHIVLPKSAHSFQSYRGDRHTHTHKLNNVLYF